MSTLSKKKVETFSKEFPFLNEVLPIEYFLKGTGKLKVLFGGINVEVADPGLLFQIPRANRHDDSICSHDNKYIGSSTVKAYSIDSDNKVIDVWEWDFKGQAAFLGDLITKSVRPVKALVLIKRYKWNRHIADAFELGLNSPVGDFSHYEYWVNIIKEPKIGFEKMLAQSNLSSNVRIDDLLSLYLYSDVNLVAKNATKEVEKARDVFVDRLGNKVWKKISSTEQSGLSGQFGKTEMLAFCTAGRIMLTLKSGGDNFTLVGDEKEWKRTGTQSMHCTVDKAKEMVNEVVENWSESKLTKSDDIFFG